MTAVEDFKITKAAKSKLMEMNLGNLPFGKHFTDHMLEVDYENGKWNTPRILPYQPLQLDPSLAALHYGQAILKVSRLIKMLQATHTFSGPMTISGVSIYLRKECKCLLCRSIYLLKGCGYLSILTATGYLPKKTMRCTSGPLCLPVTRQLE